MMGGPWGMFAMSMLPALLGQLMPHDDPKRLRQMALDQFNPANISNDQQSLFTNMMNGAGMNQARSETIGSAQAGIGAIQRHLGQTGLGRSGVGTAALGAAAAAPGINLGRLTADAWGRASQQAQGLAQQRAGTIMGMPQQPNMAMPLMGAGLNSFMPFLFKLMQQKQGMGGMHQNSPIGEAQWPGAGGDWSQAGQWPRPWGR
jgi:hypothetical protein